MKSNGRQSTRSDRPDDDDDDEDRRPRRSKKKTSGGVFIWVLLLGGGVLVLCMACGGVGGYFAFFRAGGIALDPGGMAATGQPARPGTVTMANFHRVEKCQTKSEVLDILGQPTKAIGPQDLANMRSTDSYMWVEGDTDIVVHFRNGRYVGIVAHNMR